jgi:hypothetical protein
MQCRRILVPVWFCREIARPTAVPLALITELYRRAALDAAPALAVALAVALRFRAVVRGAVVL